MENKDVLQTYRYSTSADKNVPLPAVYHPTADYRNTYIRPNRVWRRVRVDLATCLRV